MLKKFAGITEIMARNAELIITTLVSLILYFLFSLLAFSKGNSVDYMLIALPMLFLNEIIIFYGISQGAKKSLMIPICILNYASAISRLFLGFAGKRLILELAVILFFAAAIHNVFRKTSKKQITMISLAAMVLCMVYASVCEPVLGARGWVYLGGISVQVTVLAEIFYVIFAGSLFSTEMSEKNKYIISLPVTIAFTLLLILFNNIPMAFLVFSVFVLSVLIIFKDNLWKMLTIALVLVIIVSGVVGYDLVAEKMNKWECLYCETINHDTAECVQCNKNIAQMATAKYKESIYDSTWTCPDCSNVNVDTQTVCEECKIDFLINSNTFRCHDCNFISWNDAYDDDSAFMSCKNCDDLFRGGFGKVLKKLYNRFVVVVDYDKVQGTDIAYHADLCQKAIKTGGLFGNDLALVDIPNLNTDSVFAALINIMGIFFVLALLIVYFIMFISGCRTKRPIAVIAACLLMLQALYAFLGNINLLPMSGVGVPFLSRGGTSLIASYLMVYFMLTSKYESEETVNDKD